MTVKDGQVSKSRHEGPLAALQTSLRAHLKNGWSITAILVLTSLLCAVLAAVVQLAIMNRLTAQYSALHENAILTKLASTLQAQATRAQTALRAKDLGELGAQAGAILRSDRSVKIVFFYNENRMFVTYSASPTSGEGHELPRQPLLGREPLRLPLPQSGQSRSRTRSVEGFRYQETIFSLSPELGKKPNQAKPPVGYIRVITSLGEVDERVTQMRLYGIFLILLSTLASTGIFWVAIRKTVIEPIDRSVVFMKRARADLERVPQLKTKVTDAKQMRDLMSALVEGMTEVSIRARTAKFMKLTRDSLQDVDEDFFLSAAQGAWIGSETAQACRLLIARVHPQENKLLIEKSSEKNEGLSSMAGGAASRYKLEAGSGVRARLDDIKDDAVLKFLKSGKSAYWQSQVLFAKVSLSSDSESHLVLVVDPHPRAHLSEDQYTQLAKQWLTETANLYHQIRFKDLSGKLELSHELQRKWIQQDLVANEQRGRVDTALGYESIPGRFINGDFLFVNKFERRAASLVVLGDVTGQDVRAGLAATGIVAALSDRFHSIKDVSPHILIEELMQSVNRYLSTAYRGKLATGCLGLYFNHETGDGLFSCFGQPPPYVLTARERRPMVLVPNTANGLLGMGGELDFSCTPFSLLPGQVLLVSTNGLLDAEDNQGKRFEKAVQRGVLAEITERHLSQGAQSLLVKFIERTRQHAGNNSIRDDITATVLTMTSTIMDARISTSEATTIARSQPFVGRDAS